MVGQPNGRDFTEPEGAWDKQMGLLHLTFLLLHSLWVSMWRRKAEGLAGGNQKTWLYPALQDGVTLIPGLT